MSSSDDGGAFIEILRDELMEYPASISSLLGEKMKIVVLRNMLEPLMLKERILWAVNARLGGRFKGAASDFFDYAVVPSAEVVSALIFVTQCLQQSRFVSILFSDLISLCRFPRPVVVDGAILRFYFPLHFDSFYERKDLFPASYFQQKPPQDGEELSLCKNLRIGPHRDSQVPMASLPVNIWFPMQAIPKWRSLIFFPQALHEPAASFPDGLDEKTPSTWGYGSPLQFEFNLGDMVLFHSEHFHSTPWAGSEARLSGEVRVAGGCPDDHSTYRRTFFRLGNLKSSTFGCAMASADLLFNQIDWASSPPKINSSNQPALNGTVFGLLATLFDSTEDASRSLCTFEPDSMFVRQRASLRQVREVEGILRSSAEISEDCFLCLCRFLFAKGDVRGSERILRDAILKTEAYFWALEFSRYALRYGFSVVARRGLMRARALALKSDVRLFRWYPPLPTTNEHRHLLPGDAINAVDSLLEYYFPGPSIQETFSVLLRRVQGIVRVVISAILRKKVSMPVKSQVAVDAQLFWPRVRVHLLESDFQGFGLFACAGFKLFIAIPAKDGFFSPQQLISCRRYSVVFQADTEQELKDLVLGVVSSGITPPEFDA